MLRVRLLSVATALVLTLLLMTGLSGVAHADSLLIATLTNAAEVPPAVPATSTGGVRPASSGEARFFLSDDQTSMRFVATIFNIDVTGTQTPDNFDNLTAAHIHASSVIPLPPTAGVVWGFFGAPFNDNNPNDAVVIPFAAGVGGMFSGKWDLPEGNGGTTLTAQIDNILNGRAYINFHTVQFGGGEIRGQIQLVPEASSLLLLLTGLAGAVGFARRQISLS